MESRRCSGVACGSSAPRTPPHESHHPISWELFMRSRYLVAAEFDNEGYWNVPLKECLTGRRPENAKRQPKIQGNIVRSLQSKHMATGMSHQANRCPCASCLGRRPGDLPRILFRLHGAASGTAGLPERHGRRRLSAQLYRRLSAPVVLYVFFIIKTGEAIPIGGGDGHLLHGSFARLENGGLVPGEAVEMSALVGRNPACGRHGPQRGKCGSRCARAHRQSRSRRLG